MKICFLTNTLSIGSGWGRYSWEVISRLSKDHQVIVLTEEPSSEYPFVKPILKNSLKNLIYIFPSALRARKYIKQCDVIHCLDAYPYGVIGALANIGLNKKLIINGVGSYSIAPLRPIKKRGLLKKIYRETRKKLLEWTYAKADSVPCISSFFEKQLLRLIPLKNTQTVHLGIDSSKFQKSDLVSAEKIIFSVGELKRRKGYHISIPAMARVKEKYPDFKYYIVGRQDNRGFFNQLEKLVKECGLEDNVVFLERISDEELANLYRKSVLFLLTSVNIGLHFEGFGLVYLEANACGKPVIGTYNCGAEDIIINNYNGFLVPQNDIGTTAQMVLKILDNPVLAKKMGERGIERAKEMSWNNTVEKYLEIYQCFNK